MIKVVNKKTTDGTSSICIGTHNGIFHCDEVLAIAIMDNLIKENVSVIRSRDLKLLEENTDLKVDIGGGEFDHHQKGGNGERKNGVRYASAGLIWKAVGEKIISSISNNQLTSSEVKALTEIIDEDIIQNVDKEDNGQLVSSHPFQFITSFLPSWNKESNYDEKFEQCVNAVSAIFGNIVESYVAKYLAKKEMDLRIADSECHLGNVLLIPCQTIPWSDYVIEYNETATEKIDFVVFPYPAGGFALQCVAPSKENMFSQRISLPAEWAGETTRLSAISGFETATFCHNGRFFARALEYDDILGMCKAATERFNEERKKDSVKDCQSGSDSIKKRFREI